MCLVFFVMSFVLVLVHFVSASQLTLNCPCVLSLVLLLDLPDELRLALINVLNLLSFHSASSF